MIWYYQGISYYGYSLLLSLSSSLHGFLYIVTLVFLGMRLGSLIIPPCRGSLFIPSYILHLDDCRVR